MKLIIKKGTTLKIKVKNRSYLGQSEKIITVECVNNKGRKKHFFDNDNGIDYRFSNAYVENNLVEIISE